MEPNSQNECVHLGIIDDNSSIFSYPSKANKCYHAKGSPHPDLGHQHFYCLTPNHVKCPVYNNPPGEKMPKSIQRKRSYSRHTRKVLIRALTIIIPLTILILALIYQDGLLTQVERLFTPAGQVPQTAQAQITSEAPLGALPTTTPEATATLEATASVTPSPTATPTVTREPAVLALETPIGSEVLFTIVRVNPGQALGQFATRFNTTEAAIRAVNFNLPSVLHVDQILVVPNDVADTSGLPAFEAVEIQTGGITIEALAEELGVAVEDLYYYNNIQPERVLQIGEWLLVPREE